MGIFEGFTILSWICVLLGFAMNYSQYYRAKTVGIDGISVGTWSIFAWMSVFWILYGFATHNAPSSIGTIITAPLQFALLLLLGVRENRTVLLKTGVYVLVFGAVPTMLGGWAVGVLGMGFVAATNRFPQIIRCIKEKDVEGVSAAAWVWSVTSNSLWAFYFATQHRPTAVIVNISSVVMNVIVVGLTTWRHWQWKRDHATSSTN